MPSFSYIGVSSPGKKHWHGATMTTAMAHIAIAERLKGKALDST
jgi:quercetin dioxygenase-like cupin family protein